MMPDGNSYLKETMKNTTNCNYVGKNRLFSINLFKKIGHLQWKVQHSVRFIDYLEVKYIIIMHKHGKR